MFSPYASCNKVNDVVAVFFNFTRNVFTKHDHSKLKNHL
jgi:hypothetical protein